MKEYSIKISKSHSKGDWFFADIVSGEMTHSVNAYNIENLIDKIKQYILDTKDEINLLFTGDGRYFNKNNQTNPILDMRTHGEFAGKAFYLDESYDWEIKKDSQDLLVLVPERKLTNMKYPRQAPQEPELAD